MDRLIQETDEPEGAASHARMPDPCCGDKERCRQGDHHDEPLAVQLANA
jgi:hypothetical protein